MRRREGGGIVLKESKISEKVEARGNERNGSRGREET